MEQGQQREVHAEGEPVDQREAEEIGGDDPEQPEWQATHDGSAEPGEPAALFHQARFSAQGDRKTANR